MPSLNLSAMLRISTRGDGLFELTAIEGHDRIFLAGKTIDQIYAFKQQHYALMKSRAPRKDKQK